MSETYDMRNFWPKPDHGEYLLQEWVQEDGVTPALIKRYDRVVNSDYYLLIELGAQFNWLDTWNYIFTSKGVEETGDQGPNGEIYFLPGKTIFWGGNLTTGVWDGQQIIADAARLGRTTQYYDYGWHSVVTEPALHNITICNHTYETLVPLYWVQSFCSNQSCSVTNDFIGRYYMAPGLGAVKIEYYTPNNVLAGIHMVSKYALTNDPNKWVV